jgi:hypothetical protein
MDSDFEVIVIGGGARASTASPMTGAYADRDERRS